MNILMSRFHHPLALKLKGAVGKQTIATVTVCSSLGVTGGADANFLPSQISTLLTFQLGLGCRNYLQENDRSVLSRRDG